MRAVSDELIVCTDDGSYGRKALVTEPLKEMLQAGVPAVKVWAIGPTIMMKFVSLTTKPFDVPDHRQPEHDHDRRHGHVRRLPRGA